MQNIRNVKSIANIQTIPQVRLRQGEREDDQLRAGAHQDQLLRDEDQERLQDHLPILNRIRALTAL